MGEMPDCENLEIDETGKVHLCGECVGCLRVKLAEARLQYAACSNEYRRVIADLTACRTNALAAAQERDALKDEKWSLVRILDQRNHENQSLQATLEQAREAFHFIAQGHIVPGYKGEHEHPLIALAQEVIHGAQTKAREALAAFDEEKHADL